MRQSWRRLAPLAVTLCAVAAPAAAEIDWDVYGRVDVSAEYYAGGSYSAGDLASNSSRLGLRVAHTLDTGLTVYGRVERALDYNRGDGADLGARDAYLGLTDDWGVLRLGYMDTPMKEIRSRVDLFGSQLGNARNVVRAGHSPHFDQRFPNAIRYSSPEQSGWGVDLQGSFDWEDRDESDDPYPADGNDRTAISTALRYTGERFWAALGYERVAGRDEAPSSADAYRLGLEWRATDALRLTALVQATGDAYELDDDTYSDTLAYGAGLLYALEDDLDLRLQYYTLDVDASGHGASLVSVGPVFHASERLRLYATATYLGNDDASDLVPWEVGRTAGPSAEEAGIGTGRSAWAVGSGIRFDF
ncbi:porin [Halorhodospira halophila]|uniref:Porin, Gram-negative type n=1 Tax=Halorhodospira halophila (strain DSM 244 / SL1) TaxID=349124 RepID=A1WYP0_HALHL|nr:porin [Halorhodospira halophila]ABM62802.1 porin, Gram-negative type [Halorhodospira halophila SL1]